MTIAPESVAPGPEVAASESKPQPAAAPEESTPSLIAAAEEWLLSLRIAVARAIDITVLEARLAALNFALIAIVAVGSGLLLASAWIALFAAIVAWFHQLGLSWPAAFLLMAGINLVLAIVGGYTIYRMSNNMLFKAIRKFITYSENLYEEKPYAASRPAAGNPPPAP
jgi:hypothetical protein